MLLILCMGITHGTTDIVVAFLLQNQVDDTRIA